MKTVLLLLAFVTCAAAQTPTLQKNRQVLLDFRVDRKIPEIKIPAATQRNVLSKMFRRYLTDSARCNSEFVGNDSTDPLAAARKAGQIVPSIVDMATGSFTAAGQTQTLYVISVSECNASHADNFGTKRVGIFSGGQLVADVDADYASSIVRKTDLNSDGIDELLMTTGDMAQGTLTEMATLVSFPNGRRRVLQDFGSVVEDSCASEMSGATSDASVLYISDVIPGNMPKITQENYSSGCRGKTRRWRLVSRGKKGE
ncbi:MAG TPA: hypothetical protein VFI24_24065 [Pyrinomonadaceae bacterium]|nr:hypothetical protein [Pyrinomonadaceae bacterium]